MADAKISALTTHGTPVGADYVASVLASGPSSRKLLLSDLRGYTGLAHAALADADTTMAVNTMYVGSMAAWATADRTYTLPTTAAVGDRIGIMLTAGNATTFELVITAGTSDTLNGVAGGTEWSRLFITNEVVIMRCVTADAAWIVEYDGRIAQQGQIYVTTAGTTNTAGAYTNPKSSTSCVVEGRNVVGLVIDIATAIATVRRTNKYMLFIHYVPNSSITLDNYYAVHAYVDGAQLGGGFFYASVTSGSVRAPFATKQAISAGGTTEFRFRVQEANKGILNTSSMEITEVL